MAAPELLADNARVQCPDHEAVALRDPHANRSTDLREPIGAASSSKTDPLHETTEPLMALGWGVVGCVGDATRHRDRVLADREAVGEPGNKPAAPTRD